MSASLDQVRSHAPSLGMWRRLFTRHLLCKKKKKSWISVSSWIILGLSRVGWLVVWSYICFLSNTVFLQWKLWDVIRLNRRRWRIYVQIRHTYRPVSYVLRSASIFVKQGVLFIVTITYYFFSFCFMLICGVQRAKGQPNQGKFEDRHIVPRDCSDPALSFFHPVDRFGLALDISIPWFFSFFKLKPIFLFQFLEYYTTWKYLQFDFADRLCPFHWPIFTWLLVCVGG